MQKQNVFPFPSGADKIGDQNVVSLDLDRHDLTTTRDRRTKECSEESKRRLDEEMNSRQGTSIIPYEAAMEDPQRPISSLIVR